jgi:hypothetical protein
VIRRRVFAAIVLYGFAIGSALFWRDGVLDWTYMGANLIAASAGLIFLHSRWRRKEARALTPQKVKDIFS